jgi:hypothetical protein
MTAETCHTADLGRPNRQNVFLDEHSAHIVKQAACQLSVHRSPTNLHDWSLRVYLLATVIAQADLLLADAVTDARDQHQPWSHIAAQLGMTADTARRRYSPNSIRSLPIDHA